MMTGIKAAEAARPRAGQPSEAHASPDWWKSFFDDLWIEVQVRSKNEQETLAESRFLADVLELHAGQRVLDIPCGIGRHSVQLARMGMDVTGVDATKAFIERARQLSRQAHVSVTWLEQDMESIDWHQQFDSAFCFWGSFGYLDEFGNAQFIRGLADAVRPGGKVLVDTHVYETLFPRLSHPQKWRRSGDMFVLEEVSFDFGASRTNTQWTIIHKDHQYSNRTSIRLYTYHELAGLFADAGFVKLQAFGSINKDPFTLDSARLYLVASRR